MSENRGKSNTEEPLRKIDLEADAVPDNRTLCRCRHCLGRYRLTEKPFAETEKYLSAKGLLLHEARIMNALPGRSARAIHVIRRCRRYAREISGIIGMKARVRCDERKHAQEWVFFV